MALGDGIRRNIATVDPMERRLLRNAFMKMNRLKWNGNRDDTVTIDGAPRSVPGGVTWWFKQDEIHTVTHVHGGPEFLPWHRMLINWFEDLLRAVDPRLSLHYWDWTEDPRHILHANLGGGRTGPLNLFTDDFMGYGGHAKKPIGPKWRAAGFYDPNANPARTGPFDPGYNAADTPACVERSVAGPGSQLVKKSEDRAVVTADEYLAMSSLLEHFHDLMHGYVDMGDQHTSFRDPFVFLLHSNVDRLFALWQTQPRHKERLHPDHVYGRASHNRRLNGNIEPWSTGHSKDNELRFDHYTRPWYQLESLGVPIKYKDPSIITPRRYAKSVHRPSQS